MTTQNLAQESADVKPIAFPGAEGFGKYTTGGGSWFLNRTTESWDGMGNSMVKPNRWMFMHTHWMRSFLTARKLRNREILRC